MASVSSTINVILNGSAAGLVAAANAARLALRGVSEDSNGYFRDSQGRFVAQGREFTVFGISVTKALAGVSKAFGVLATASKGLAILGAAGGAIQLIAGVTAALQQLLPIALLAPAAILAIGAAYATVKIALAGFGDALGGDAEALGKLAPAARETVLALRGLAPEFDKVKQAVQQNFFRDFSAEVKDLGSRYLPVLAERLPLIANGFNRMGRSLAFALKQPSTVTAIDTVLENTARLIDNARNSLGAFARGFIELGSFGSDYLPKIGIAIDGVAQRFERFVKGGLQDGSIKRFVDDAIQGFRDLGAIVGNVGDILGSIFKGLAGEGNASPLASLRALTEELAAFFKTAEAQGPLQALGETLRVVAGIVSDVLIAGLKAIGPVVEAAAPIVQKLAEVVGKILVEAFEKLGPPIERLLIKLAPVLGPALDFIGDVIVNVVIPALVSFVDEISATIDKIELFALKSIIEFASATGAVLGFVSGFLGAMQSMFSTLGQVPGAFGQPFRDAASSIQVSKDKVDSLRNTMDLIKDKTVTAVAFVQGRPALGNLDDTLARLRDKTVDVGVDLSVGGQKVQPGGESPFDAFFKSVSDGTQQLGRDIGDGLAQAGTALSDFGATVQAKIGEVGTFFSELPDKVGAALAEFGTFLATSADEAMTALGATIQTKIDEAGAFFDNLPYKAGFALGELIGTVLRFGEDLGTNLGNATRAAIDNTVLFFSELPGKVGTALVSLRDTVVTAAVTAGTDFLASITTGFQTVVDFVVGFPARVGESLAPVGPTVAGKAQEAGSGFLATITQWFNDSVAFVTGLPARIGAGISAVVGILGAKATEAGTSFLNGITSTFNTVVGFVQGIPGRIAGAIGNLGGLLVGAGRSVIDGLLAGIRAGVQAMYDFVSGIAAGIAARKGPLSYDRTVLRPAGLALMGGLLSSMQLGYRDIQAFAGGIADDLAGTINAGSIIADAGAATAAFSTSARTPSSASDIPALLRRLLAAQEAKAEVRVFIGDQELRGIVRTEVASKDRATVRATRVGAGVS